MRILAVDTGSKHIGLAISDLTGTIANPLKVLSHSSRLADSAAVAEIACANQVGLIVVGQSLDDDGQPTFEGRRAMRFAEVLKSQSRLPVVLWDESFTTQEARAARLAANARDPAQLTRAHDAAHDLFSLALELGGSVSGEHGIGTLKRGQLRRQWAPRAVELHRAIKSVFDPKGLLNPGKKEP